MKWEQGSTVEVSWSIEANHGGGYLYRLCPADSELDEDCFRKNPLEFTGKQVLRWGGKNGTQIEIDVSVMAATEGVKMWLQKTHTRHLLPSP